jgi:hypothetical protein
MVEIKDQDILEAFKLEDKNSGEKVLHGILRYAGKILVVFERNSGEPYTGFLEKSIFDPNSLNEKQIQFLKNKGYEI